MASLLIVVTAAIAGPEKVAFPAYQTHVLYDVLDQPDNKEVRELYANAEALKGLKAGQPLPSGTVLSAPTFKALLNDKGELVKDANGRLIRGPLNRIVVMEKRTGWGLRISRRSSQRRLGMPGAFLNQTGSHGQM